MMDELNQAIRNQNFRHGGAPVPPGMWSAVKCVRAVIFQDVEFGYPAVNGTGFLTTLFGDVFFITAPHVVDNRSDYDINTLRVFYDVGTHTRNIEFSEVRRFETIDLNDTDHVDIIIFKADPKKLDIHLFGDQKPFDYIRRSPVQFYHENEKMYFYGYSPDHSEYDYENRKYQMSFYGGDIYYRAPELHLRAVHTGIADVNASCPDFDCLSGAPLFKIIDINDASSIYHFSGMCIRATRSSKIFYFIDASNITSYILNFFVHGLSEEESKSKLLTLMSKFIPNEIISYRIRNHIRAKSYFVTLFGGRSVFYTP